MKLEIEEKAIEETRIKYEKEIEDLKEEVNNLKNKNMELYKIISEVKALNEKLLIKDADPERKGAEVHSFYQDIFITDLQKEINRKDEEMSNFKMKYIERSDAYMKLQQK